MLLRAESIIPSIGRTSVNLTRRCVVGLALLGPTARTASAQEPLSAFSRTKAVTLLREQLPCLGCHALGEEGGRLAPDLATVGSRRSAAYIAGMVDDPQRQRPGAAMPRPRLPRTTRDLVVRFLAQREGAGGPAPTPPLPPLPARDGPALYAFWCAGCHGATGKGDGPNAARLPVRPSDHTDRARMSARPDDALFDTIAGGGAIMNRSPRMPAFGGTLGDPEIRALVAHIRTLCRCEGPAWSRGGDR